MKKKQKPVWEKKRPKSIGKPKSFNTKTKTYAKVKRKADRLFGKKVSLVKNMYISKMIKKR
jgi:hypothetical protein